MIFNLLLTILIAYLFGSFPTAIIAGKLLKKIDIREHGSGNAGATNVVRVLGWKAGLVVLLIDMIKGFLPVFWIASFLSVNPHYSVYFQIAAAVAAICGHIWTVFAQFKGGKGVGTAAGAFLGLAPLSLGLALIIFTIIVWITRYVSLGSLLASLTFIIILFLQRFLFNQNIHDVLLYLSIIIVALIWYAHRSNIKRLLNKSESKIKFSGK